MNRTTTAASLTRVASKQTYYTIRFLVDRELVPDAYRAYAYFRWVDDTLDQDGIDRADRLAFLNRQTALMENCYRGDWPGDLTVEERMLVDLVRGDRGQDSGLQSYIRNMMSVMAFDAHRRGRLITQAELSDYARNLATAVTEALLYFIGHYSYSPRGDTRYLAVTAAHITHMLRDTVEDTDAGYYNIPREVLELHALDPQDVSSNPYRAWVRSRVELARGYFREGKAYLAQIENTRCRTAGYAYTARFEWVLDAIEREGYLLRADYSERKSAGAVRQMAWSALNMAVSHRRQAAATGSWLPDKKPISPNFP